MHRRIRIYVEASTKRISTTHICERRNEKNEKRLTTRNVWTILTSENASCNIDVNGGNGGENGQRISLIIYRIRCHVSSPPRFKGISLEEKNPRRPTHARACKRPSFLPLFNGDHIIHLHPSPRVHSRCIRYDEGRGVHRVVRIDDRSTSGPHSPVKRFLVPLISFIQRKRIISTRTRFEFADLSNRNNLIMLLSTMGG